MILDFRTNLNTPPYETKRSNGLQTSSQPQQELNTITLVSKMPPKRKLTGAAGGRGAKRVASGNMTPVSVDESSDEYTEGGEEASEGEAEDLKSAKTL